VGVTEVYERCMFFFERYHHRGNWWFVYYTSSPIHRAKELVFEGNTFDFTKGFSYKRNQRVRGEITKPFP
jgi:hypothetical protein